MKPSQETNMSLEPKFNFSKIFSASINQEWFTGWPFMCYSVAHYFGFPKDRKWAWATCYCSSISASKLFPNYRNRKSSSNFCSKFIQWLPVKIIFLLLATKAYSKLYAILIRNFWPLTFIIGEVILKLSSYGLNTLSYTSLPCCLICVLLLL
jgi:hypothetical protein